MASATQPLRVTPVRSCSATVAASTELVVTRTIAGARSPDDATTLRTPAGTSSQRNAPCASARSTISGREFLITSSHAIATRAPGAPRPSGAKTVPSSVQPAGPSTSRTSIGSVGNCSTA
jgi:hypothetical protein